MIVSFAVNIVTKKNVLLLKMGKQREIILMGNLNAKIGNT